MIPDRFMCFGHWVTVEYDPELMKKNGVMGYAAYEENKIILQPNVPGMQVSDTQVEETFEHERTHYILLSIEKEELSNDEEFVGLFSRVWHQTEKTAVYDYEEVIKKLKSIIIDEDAIVSNQSVFIDKILEIFREYV